MKSYKRFEELLRLNGQDTTMFWHEQYALWIKGYRGVDLHSATYILMEA